MGGVVNYSFLGETAPGSNEFYYELRIKVYFNCDENSSVPDPEPIKVGIYRDVVSNSKPLYDNFILSPNDTSSITANVTGNCPVAEDVCINEGIYVDTIILEGLNQGDTALGYHVLYDRCCRNNNIDNLWIPGNQSMGFYGFIPSPLKYPDSSPEFTSSVAPFLCIQDSITFSFNAFDSDGDSLVYQLYHPFTGNSTSINPDPNPTPFITMPLPEVIWAVGFNENEPFGASGQMEINVNSGISNIYIPNQGSYVLGVEVQEYRDGEYLSSTYLDIQINTVVCPPNEYPEASIDPGDTLVFEYEVIGGDTLCFPIQFSDADMDSLTLEITGELFDTALTINAAMLSDTLLDSGFAQVHFCWETICENASDLPYFFYVNAVDNGCPNKSTPAVYQIMVNDPPNEAPTPNLDTVIYTIQAGDQLCFPIEFWDEDKDTISYNVYGHLFDTTLVNDTAMLFDLIQNVGYSSLTLCWRSLCDDIGTFIVHAEGTDNRCPTQTSYITYIINVAPYTINASVEASPICLGDTVMVEATYGELIAWSPNYEILDSTSAQTHVHPDTSNIYYVWGLDSNNCEAIDSIFVEVFPYLETYTSPDLDLCKGNTANIQAFGGLTYEWSPLDNLNNAPNDSSYSFVPEISVDYQVTINDVFGCTHHDSLSIRVYEIPISSFEYELSYFCDSVLLSVENTSVNSENQVWYMNDTEFSTSETPSIPVQYDDSFYVSLTAFNANNCPDDFVQNVKTLSKSEYFDIKVPNVITPNNDNINDVFITQIKDEFTDCGASLLIYNRWGKEIFNSSETGTLKWSGELAGGSSLKEGVYYYVLKLDKELITGHITVLY